MVDVAKLGERDVKLDHTLFAEARQITTVNHKYHVVSPTDKSLLSIILAAWLEIGAWFTSSPFEWFRHKQITILERLPKYELDCGQIYHQATK